MITEAFMNFFQTKNRVMTAVIIVAALVISPNAFATSTSSSSSSSSSSGSGSSGGHMTMGSIPGHQHTDEGEVCLFNGNEVDCQCNCIAPQSECGDGEVTTGEDCDDAIIYLPADGFTCVDCHKKPFVCGNGIKEAGEECDHAGLNGSADTCSATCEIQSVCGNGALESGEECDDSNANSGDGCDSSCKTECPTTSTVTMNCSQPPAPATSTPSSTTSSDQTVNCTLEPALPSGNATNWTPVASPASDCTATVSTSTGSTAEISISKPSGSTGDSCSLTVSATTSGGCSVNISPSTTEIDISSSADPADCAVGGNNVAFNNCGGGCSGHTKEGCGENNDEWVVVGGNCQCNAACSQIECEE